MKKILFILFCLTVIFSCSKDETADSNNMNNNNTSSNSLKLKQVLKNGEIWSKYEYNENGSLYKADLYIENGEFWKNKIYSYVKDTVFVEYLNPNSLKTIIEKSYWVNKLQIRIDDYQESQLMGYRLYNYEENYCNYTTQEYFGADGLLLYKSIYNHLDLNCSWESIDYNPINISNYIEIKIDDKKSAFESTITETFKLNDYPALGNYLSRAYKDDKEIVREDLSYNIEYIYNDYNYPTSSTRTYLDGTVDTFTFEYY